jgi:phosphate starvation-inducible PhoH-like protein
MVLVDGPAGTAKTFLAVYAGLLLLQEKKIKNIIYIRSIVESATKSIGALPGELDEKFKPWSLALLDKLNELLLPQTSNELIESGTIKCIPVNFVRGLTFHDSLVIIDEFQNLTFEEGVTILTRFGHNSKYIAIGDARQADIGSKSGFKDLFNAFDDDESAEQNIHTFRFGDNEIVRSKILRFIVGKIASIKRH